ncbi:MAG: peptidylprolyl isomerase [candidate division WOR-3 bacterium]|nr:peptidylprolyl isomerase [candidate division WOR-3 bacterium]
MGRVVAGMDVVAKIAAVKTGPNDKPITPVIMEKVELE